MRAKRSQTTNYFQMYELIHYKKEIKCSKHHKLKKTNKELKFRNDESHIIFSEF